MVLTTTSLKAEEVEVRGTKRMLKENLKKLVDLICGYRQLN